MTRRIVISTEAAVGKDEEQFVVFTLKNEEFGVGISRAREIIKLTNVTRLLEAPGFIEGVINLRGQVVPVLNLRKRSDIQEENATKKPVL